MSTMYNIYRKCQKQSLTKMLPLILLALVAVLCTASNSRAELASSEEMAQVGENWLAYMVHQTGSWAGESSPIVERVVEMVEGDVLVARVYHINPRGYIVVPVLKDLPPVKAFSDESNIDVNAAGGFAAMLREQIKTRIEYFVKKYVDLDAVEPAKGDRLFDPVNRQNWDTYVIPTDEFKQVLQTSKLDPMDEAGPLLTSSWHQGAPYNNYCPMGDGGRTVVGCVSTAITQIMNYWQWPDMGEGSHQYYWSGDNSCGGSSPGQTLSADFSDPYDWDNIPDDCHSGCSGTEAMALAELCYEVGISVNMDYGHCGSGAYASTAAQVLEQYFKYDDGAIMTHRYQHSAASWFAVVQDEVNNLRPMQYFITAHEIVCDGWRVTTQNYYHMNYGWDDGHTAWYTIDNIYGNESMYDESIVRYIQPFNAVSFTADQLVGPVPHDVTFTAASDLVVDSWAWDFGDGDSAFVQNPIHQYQTPGIYDVRIEIIAGSDSYASLRTDYIVATADTLECLDVSTEPGETVEVIICGSNSCSLDVIRIPIEYSGEILLTPQSYSTVGCRTEDCESVNFAHYDPSNERLTFDIEAGSAGALPPGEGPVLKVYFVVSSSAKNGEQNSIRLDGYDDYQPTFRASVAVFEPVTFDGIVTIGEGGACCFGDRGNVNNDPSDAMNIADVTYLVAYLFNSGASPECEEEADINADGAVNIADLTCLVACLFGGNCSCVMPCP